MLELLLIGLFQAVVGAPALPPADAAPSEVMEEYETTAPADSWDGGGEGSAETTAAADSRGEPRLKRSCYYERNSGWRFRMQRCDLEEVYPGDPGYEDAEPMTASARDTQG